MSELSSAAFLPQGDPPRAWLRRVRAPGNMVVVADGQLVVGTLAKDKLDTARKLLGQGIVVQEIFGPKATYIPLHSIRRVRVQLNTTIVEVRYDKGPNRANCKIHMANGKAQAEVFAVLRHYAKGAESQQVPGNRLQHALRPINLAVILLLASAAAYWYYEADIVNRLKAAAAEQRSDEEVVTQRSYRPPVWMRKNPRGAAIVLIVVAAVSTVLDGLGKLLVLSGLLLGATGCVFWAVHRFANPPTCLVLSVPGRGL